ncbi:hypothetical protein [Leptolyngbya sp. NIES-2104]|nr:hypothetical protein [Leptolyngbya sp. NIES-2104]GAP95956.1 hypothetical protein NIES2104_24850 [Leptolyngbya sp. NIES-2104]
MISSHLECQLSAIEHQTVQLIDRSPNDQKCDRPVAVNEQIRD